MLTEQDLDDLYEQMLKPVFTNPLRYVVGYVTRQRIS